MRALFKTTLAGVFLAATIGLSFGVSAQVLSLRGDRPLDAADNMAPDRHKQETASGGFERSWKLQPPTIPHNIDNDRITLKENTCLNCHSEANFKKEKAPKIGDSHFIDREGNKLADMNQRRHFCNQCHVPQLDASPLVENTFAGAK